MDVTGILGVDCGLTGGLALLDLGGGIISLRPFPVRSNGRRKEVDLGELDRVILDARRAGYEVAVEDPGGHARSASGLRSMTRCFTAVETLCVARNLRHHVFDAKTWQRGFWARPKMPKGTKFDTKAAAFKAAGRLWPGERFLAGPRSTIPHDGLIDAALIAEYARRTR